MYVAPGFLDRFLAFAGVLVVLAIFFTIAFLTWGKKGKEDKNQRPLQSSGTSPLEIETKSIRMTDGTFKDASSMLNTPLAGLPSESPLNLYSGSVATGQFIEMTLLSSLSWVLLMLCAVLCATSLWLSSRISNYGSIADLQAQTNDVLFAVVVALASVATGIAALFLRLCARSTV